MPLSAASAASAETHAWVAERRRDETGSRRRWTVEQLDARPLAPAKVKVLVTELQDRPAKEAWLAGQRKEWAHSLQRRRSRDHVQQVDARRPLEPTADVVAAQRKREWIRQRKLEHDERLRYRQHYSRHWGGPAPLVPAELLSTPLEHHAWRASHDTSRRHEPEPHESPMEAPFHAGADAKQKGTLVVSHHDMAVASSNISTCNPSVPSVYLQHAHPLHSDHKPNAIHTAFGSRSGSSMTDSLSSRLRGRPPSCTGSSSLVGSSRRSTPERLLSHSAPYRRGRAVVPNELVSPSTSLCRVNDDDVLDVNGTSCSCPSTSISAAKSHAVPSLARALPTSNICSRSSEVIRVDDITFLKRR